MDVIVKPAFVENERGQFNRISDAPQFAFRTLSGIASKGCWLQHQIQGLPIRKFSHARIPSAYGIPGHQAG